MDELSASKAGFAERIRGAFDPRRTLRTLVAAPEGRLRPLDGWRALSILWLVAFHTGWYIGRHVPLPVYGELLGAWWMLPIWRGDFGVDVFFVLSGFLIAGMLIDERDRAGRVHIGLFYVRRLMRLWPALVVAVIVHALFIGHQTEKSWANLLYINNFLPILQASMGWTWSLSIEEQFYLLCPWLVSALAPTGPRARLLVISAITLGLCVGAAWIVVAGDFHAFDSEIVVNRDFLRWANAYDHLYNKPWMRAGPLLAGVASAYVYRRESAMGALSRSRVLPVLGAVIAVACAVVCTHWPLVEHAPRPLEIAYLAAYRTVFGLAIAYLLLLSVSRHPLGVLLGRALASRVFYPIAQLAYSAYLLNPIVTDLVHQAAAPLVWAGRAQPIPLFLPLDVIATFLAAAVVYLLVERPIMDLRPREQRIHREAGSRGVVSG